MFLTFNCVVVFILKTHSGDLVISCLYVITSIFFAWLDNGPSTEQAKALQSAGSPGRSHLPDKNCCWWRQVYKVYGAPSLWNILVCAVLWAVQKKEVEELKWNRMLKTKKFFYCSHWVLLMLYFFFGFLVDLHFCSFPISGPHIRWLTFDQNSWFRTDGALAVCWTV